MKITSKYHLGYVHNENEPVKINVELFYSHEYHIPHRFVCKKGTNEELEFNTHEEALKYLNDNIKPEYIHDDCLPAHDVPNDDLYK